MDVGVQVPPRAHMMTPTVAGWGFCFTTLPRTPACAHTFYTLTPTLRSVASHPLLGSIRNLHHRLAGHNSIVISPILDHVLWPQNLTEAWEETTPTRDKSHAPVTK